MSGSQRRSQAQNFDARATPAAAMMIRRLLAHYSPPQNGPLELFDHGGCECFVGRVDRQMMQAE